MDRLTPLIAFHITTALLALGLGAAMFARPKGTPSHRLLGRIWVASLAATALGSFWIRHDGHFSWIHFLSAWTLFGLAMAVWCARRGNIQAHRGWMIGLYLGLAIAGLFTLLPSRLLGSLVFGI
jgi:uncharacterized membrane protein